MTYTEIEIKRQLQLGEDSNWEFKTIEFSGSRAKSPSRDDLADEIAAFANAEGGILLCSVTDDGNLRCMTKEQIIALDSLFVELSTDTIKPPVRIRTHHRWISDKRLILVEIPKGATQHDSPGGSYVRVGGSKRKMTSDERVRLAQRRGQARFPSYDEQTVPGTGFATLDESLYRPLLSAEGALEPESALVKQALLTNDEAGILRATVAGVLICTRNPELWLPNAGITATCYLGRDRASNQIDAQEISGPLNRQVHDALAFATRNMRVAARKEPARVNLPQYSDRALFEAIVNAAVHRDYSIRGSKIRLSMFADRLEIQSPGALPNNLTIDSMSERQVTRNEALTSVLARMHIEGIPGSRDRHFFMERRGDGVPIIRRETRELTGKLPEFRLVNGSEVLVIIPAADLEQSPATTIITVRSAGQPLAGSDVLALFPNKTWKRATTNENGESEVELHTTNLPMTIFVSGRGYAAHVESDWIPSQRSLAIEMEPLPEGGSVIFPEATGYLPTIKGRLNPIRDSLDRTYLYVSNVAIDRGKQQPVHFVPGKNLRLTDSDGKEALVRIIDLVGRSAILEYRQVTR